MFFSVRVQPSDAMSDTARDFADYSSQEFDAKLLLRHEEAGRYMGFARSRFEEGVDIRCTEVGSNTDFFDATVEGNLYAWSHTTGWKFDGTRLSVTGDLNLRSAEVGSLKLTGADVDGSLDLKRADVGTADLRDASIGRLRLGSTDVDMIDLRGASIDELEADEASYDIRVDEETSIGSLPDDMPEMEAYTELTTGEQEFLDAVAGYDGAFTYDELREDMGDDDRYTGFLTSLRSKEVIEREEESYRLTEAGETYAEVLDG